jgi:hypothetical protein
VVAAATSSTDEQEHSTEPAPPEHEAHGVEPHGAEADEPSADWGWHGSFPVGGRVTGWISIVFLFCMAFFDHEGLSQTWWLVVLASVLAVALLAKDVTRRSRPH